MPETKYLALNAIYNMDCVEGMSRMEASSVDLIITDPPFAIDFKADHDLNKTHRCIMASQGRT